MNIPEIEPEGGPGQHLHFVTHHRHFVQRWLTVKDDKVVVLHVSLYLVPDLKVKVARLGMVSQVDPVAIVTDNVFGSWILIGSSSYQLAKSV